jgi:hypothetical protein
MARAARLTARPKKTLRQGSRPRRKAAGTAPSLAGWVRLNGYLVSRPFKNGL